MTPLSNTLEKLLLFLTSENLDLPEEPVGDCLAALPGSPFLALAAVLVI